MTEAMHAVAAGDRSRVAHLLTDTDAPRSFVDCVLQGHGGLAWVDDVGAPRFARLAVGPFTMFGGDANAPSARDVVGLLGEWTMIVAPDKPWRELALEAHTRVSVGQRSSFVLRDPDRAQLQQMATGAPDGYAVQRLDLALARRIGEDVDRVLLPRPVFSDPEDFIARSVGYCVTIDGRIAAGATAAVPYDGGFEIQVNTHEAHRGLGLATSACAALILHALDEGLDPRWDTASTASAGLARKLGYVATDTYEMLTLGR